MRLGLVVCTVSVLDAGRVQCTVSWVIDASTSTLALALVDILHVLRQQVCAGVCPVCIVRVAGQHRYMLLISVLGVMVLAGWQATFCTVSNKAVI